MVERQMALDMKEITGTLRRARKLASECKPRPAFALVRRLGTLLGKDYDFLQSLEAALRDVIVEAYLGH